MSYVLRLVRVITDLARSLLPPPVRRDLVGVRERAVQTAAWRRFGDIRYRTWLRSIEPTKRDVESLRLPVADGPMISIIMPVYRPDVEHLREAIESVFRQTYENWELILVDDCSRDQGVRAQLEGAAGRDPERVKLIVRSENGGISRATNDALAEAQGAFVAFLDHDDLLADLALYFVVRTIQMYPQARVIYSDEDKLDHRGLRHNPHFKPGWNPELLRAYNYFCHLLVVEAGLVEEVGGLRPEYDGAQDFDLVLRCVEAVPETSIVHIPVILYHWRVTPQSTSSGMAAKPQAVGAGMAALRAAYPECNVTAEGGRNFYRTTAKRPDLDVETVTIVIPTRDGGDVLRRCVESVLKNSPPFPTVELLIVDNGSTDPGTVEFLAGLSADGRATVHRDDRPFNYSQLNNDAVTDAKGDVLLLLNDDTEVLSADWLEKLLLHLVPGVGIVGPRLLYPDGRVQHAGIVVGGYAAIERFKFVDGSSDGYMSRLQISASVSAVTGACMLVRTDCFRSIGGFDAAEFPVGYSDVDLCLRARRAGWRSVYAGNVELIHHESVSRKNDSLGPEGLAKLNAEIARLWRRWGAVLLTDDMYSPYLSYDRGDFGLSPEAPPVLAWTGDVEDVRGQRQQIPSFLTFAGR